PRAMRDHEPRALEDAQVFHDPEAGHLEALLQLRQRLPVALAERIEQLAPRRVGERFEDVFHAPTICDPMVTYVKLHQSNDAPPIASPSRNRDGRSARTSIDVGLPAIISATTRP